MSPLTPKAKEIFDYIQNYLDETGYSPSQREIARAFGLSSLGTVQKHLKTLEGEGLLSRDWNARRGLRLQRPRPSGTELPLAGTVAAGKPIEAVQTPDTLDVPPSMLGTGEHIVLRVQGESMIGDGILEGDYVVVRRQATAENGQTVVALIDNEATVKRFHRRGERIELHPANPAMTPIPVPEGADFRIEGVVVGVIRHCR